MPISANGAAFVEANRKSPVVSGAVIGRGGRGCRYTLADGRTFRLSSEDCKAIGKPDWANE